MNKKRWSASTLFLLVAVLVNSPATVAKERDCKLQKYAAIELASFGGSFLVPVTLQGTQAFMVLDLSQPVGLLTEAAAKRIGLKLQLSGDFADAKVGGKPIKRIATAEGYSFGSLKFKSAQFLVDPDSDYGVAPGDVPIVGTMGMSGLSDRFDIELDLANRRMNVFSQDHCRGKVVYWAQQYDSAPFEFSRFGELYFPMELEGKKIQATLSTQRATTTLSTDVTRALFNFDALSPDVETELGADGATRSTYRAMKLSGKGLEIINARIRLIDRPKEFECHLGRSSGAMGYDDCLGVHPLNLGLNVLSKLRIYIALQEKRIYFTPSVLEPKTPAVVGK